MSGHHNMKIYTGKDTPVCRECKHGEAVKSAYAFREESYICWSKKGYPTPPFCKGFEQANEIMKRLFKLFTEYTFHAHNYIRNNNITSNVITCKNPKTGTIHIVWRHYGKRSHGDIMYCGVQDKLSKFGSRRNFDFLVTNDWPTCKTCIKAFVAAVRNDIDINAQCKLFNKLVDEVGKEFNSPQAQ